MRFSGNLPRSHPHLVTAGPLTTISRMHPAVAQLSPLSRQPDRGGVKWKSVGCVTGLVLFLRFAGTGAAFREHRPWCRSFDGSLIFVFRIVPFFALFIG